MDEQNFEGLYTPFRENRIRMLEAALGKEFFTPNTRILEVGAGGGQTSIYFRDTYGCRVVCTEGREGNFRERMEANGIEFYVLDLENDLYPILGPRKFDLIIHWGVLYHLDNWMPSLIQIGDYLDDNGVLSLESEVINGTEIAEIKVNESSSVWDQALSSIGTRMTAASVESFLDVLGFTFIQRYDDPSLNVSIHRFDWAEDPNVTYDTNKTHRLDEFEVGLRRFWLASRQKEE